MPVLKNSQVSLWPKVTGPDVDLVMAHWRAAKAGITSLWPAVPKWLSRYMGEMSSAHAHSFTADGPFAAAAPSIVRKS